MEVFIIHKPANALDTEMVFMVNYMFFPFVTKFVLACAYILFW